jgi:hypothetical protein
MSRSTTSLTNLCCRSPPGSAFIIKSFRFVSLGSCVMRISFIATASWTQWQAIELLFFFNTDSGARVAHLSASGLAANPPPRRTQNPLHPYEGNLDQKPFGSHAFSSNEQTCETTAVSVSPLQFKATVPNVFPGWSLEHSTSCCAFHMSHAAGLGQIGPWATRLNFFAVHTHLWALQRKLPRVSSLAPSEITKS